MNHSYFSFVIVACMLTASCASTGQMASRSDGGPVALHYEIEPSKCGDKPCLKVMVEFVGNDKGSEKLILPSSGWGQKRLDKAIHGLRAKTDKVALQKLTPNTYRFLFPRNTKVVFEYNVIQDFERPLDFMENYYRAIVQPDYFHFIGHAVFVYPELDPVTPIDVTLDWKGVSPDQVANSFGARELHQQFSSDLRTFRGGVFLGGGIKLSKLGVRGRPVWIASRGEFGFKDADFQSLVERVLITEREFWRDDDFPYFLISVLSVSNDDKQYGGAGTPNGFAIFAGRKTKIDSDLTHLLFHELFHTWNGRKIGRQEPEELVYWFSEGFTDYYARVLSLRAGLITLEEYVDEYNEKIRNYWGSPVRNEPSQRVLKDFWNNTSVEKLPYQQGDILAHRWNFDIEERSKSTQSLDNFMRDLLKAGLQGEVVSLKTINELMKTYIPEGIEKDIERFVEKGETLEVTPPKMGDCIELQQKETHAYDLGFDLQASRKSKLVTGVRPGGPAERAGLKNGRVLKGWSVTAGDIEHDAEFFIETDTGEKRIAFVPRGEKITVPYYVLDPEKYKRKPKVCASIFSAVE